MNKYKVNGEGWRCKSGRYRAVHKTNTGTRIECAALEGFDWILGDEKILQNYRIEQRYTDQQLELEKDG